MFFLVEIVNNQISILSHHENLHNAKLALFDAIIQEPDELKRVFVDTETVRFERVNSGYIFNNTELVKTLQILKPKKQKNEPNYDNVVKELELHFQTR